MTPSLKHIGLSGKQIYYLNKKYTQAGKRVGLGKSIKEEVKKVYSNDDGKLSAKKIARFVFWGENPVKAREIDNERKKYKEDIKAKNESEKNKDDIIF